MAILREVDWLKKPGDKSEFATFLDLEFGVLTMNFLCEIWELCQWYCVLSCG